MPNNSKDVTPETAQYLIDRVSAGRLNLHGLTPQAVIAMAEYLINSSKPRENAVVTNTELQQQLNQIHSARPKDGNKKNIALGGLELLLGKRILGDY